MPERFRQKNKLQKWLESKRELSERDPPSINFKATTDGSSGDLVLITLDAATMDWDSFYSNERGKLREVVITTRIGKQPTIIGFKVDRENNIMGNIFGTVLYLGLAQPLPLSIEVIESDKDVRDALSLSSTIFNAASANMSMLPPNPFSSPLTASLTLTSALLDVAKKAVDDDEELIFETTLVDDESYDECDDGSNQEMACNGEGEGERNLPVTPKIKLTKLKTGTITISRGSGFSMTLGVTRFNSPSPPSDSLVYAAMVILKSIELPFDRNDKNLRGRIITVHTSFGSSKHATMFDVDFPGQNGNAYWEDVVKIENRLIYYGPFDPVLPYQAKISSGAQEAIVDIAGLVDAGTTFANAISSEYGDDWAKTSTKLAKKGLTKALSSAHDLTREFVNQRDSLLSKSGVIVPVSDDIPLPSKKLMPLHPKKCHWQTFSLTESKTKMHFAVRFIPKKKDEEEE